MIVPVLKDDALLEDIQQAAAQSHEQFHLWWLGQSGFLLQWQQQHLLLDPYLSDSLTRKYAGTDKPHVRMTEQVVRPERLTFVQAVTSTHNHTDHLDAETLGPLMAGNPELIVVVPAANQEFAAERLQVAPARLSPLDAGQSLRVGPFQIHAVPAAHEQLERDEAGRCRYLGYVVEFGPWAVYHSGDTVRYEGMAEQLRQWPITVALLPINGQRPERKVPGNLWGREAVELARDIGAQLVIPCHFEMFEFNTVTPDEFIRSAEQLGQPYRVLRCGERWSSAELQEK